MDDSGAGSEIDCPECGFAITIPEPTHQNIRATPTSSTAAAKQERHFSLPQTTKPTQIKIEKPRASLEFAAKDVEKKLRVKCIKHHECIEVGHDRFDEIVTEFLGKVGEANIVSIATINYSHGDIGSTSRVVTDFGVLIVYKG